MRKEVKLGLSIGGMAAIVLGYVTLFGDKSDKHPVELADQTNGEVGGEVDSTTQIKVPADSFKSTVLIATDRDKSDPTWGNSLWPTKTSVTQTPDATGGRTLGGISREAETRGNTGAPHNPGRIDALVNGNGNVAGGSNNGSPSNGGRTAIGGTHNGSASGSTVAGGKATAYTIQQGDTFSSIAARHYGDRNLYRVLVAANPRVDPTRLKIGTEIIVPDSSTFQPSGISDGRSNTASGRTTAKADPKTEYEVVSGDSLHRIATKLYGNINKVDALYELNKNTIGPDPAKLKLGMILKLPNTQQHAQVN